MNVVSVNAGQPREVAWRGDTVRTGIFKSPVAGPVPIGRTNVQGDAQADLRVHGGPDKAVYAFAAEHYVHWQERYPQRTMHWGFFGENLTTRGLRDSDVHSGDILHVGSVELRVTLPRLPCSRLALRFDDPNIVAAFLKRGRVGFYCAVQQQGVVQAGDRIEIEPRQGSGLSIPELVALYTGVDGDPVRLEQAAADPALPGSWRQRFQDRRRQLG